MIADLNCYFTPTKWNAAGYDALCVKAENSTSRLRYIFLHMTREKEHNFNPEPFVEVLQALGEQSKHNVGAFELWCVVPRVIMKQFSSKVNESSFRKLVRYIVFAESSTNIRTRIVTVGVDYPYRHAEN